MLDCVRGSGCCEALLDCLQHHVAHVRAGDARVGDRRPGDDLPVESIDDEGETSDLAVPAGELQTVRTPAQDVAYPKTLALFFGSQATLAEDAYDEPR